MLLLKFASEVFRKLTVLFLEQLFVVARKSKVRGGLQQYAAPANLKIDAAMVKKSRFWMNTIQDML